MSGVIPTERIINIERMEQIVNLFGNFDENIKKIENQYSVRVTSHGSNIKVIGDEENVDFALRAINGILSLINKGETITDQNVDYVMSLVADGDEDKVVHLADSNCICITSKENFRHQHLKHRAAP